MNGQENANANPQLLTPRTCLALMREARRFGTGVWEGAGALGLCLTVEVEFPQLLQFAEGGGEGGGPTLADFVPYSCGRGQRQR